MLEPLVTRPTLRPFRLSSAMLPDMPGTLIQASMRRSLWITCNKACWSTSHWLSDLCVATILATRLLRSTRQFSGPHSPGGPPLCTASMCLAPASTYCSVVQIRLGCNCMILRRFGMRLRDACRTDKADYLARLSEELSWVCHRQGDAPGGPASSVRFGRTPSLALSARMVPSARANLRSLKPGVNTSGCLRVACRSVLLISSSQR